MNLSLAPSFSGKAFTKKGQYVQDKKETNAYNREYSASPVFSFNAGVLSAGEETLLDFFEDKPAMQKYGAMTNIVISNNSAVELKIYLNQDRNRIITVPAGVIRSLEQHEIQGGVISAIVKNNDGSTATTDGQVIIETFKTGVEMESTFQKLHKKFFKIGGF